MSLCIHPIPAFTDNYFWIFHQHNSSEATVVDPGAAEPVHRALRERGLTLTSILITHHHPDHTGGVPALVQAYGVPVYGPDSSLIPGVTDIVAEGDILLLAGQKFKVLAVPGHTLDHQAYFTEPGDDAPVLFCGDTLFAGGCGRLFEGSPAMMLASLYKIAALDPSTRIFCAHEYTRANLLFAQAVEPENQTITQRLAAVDLLLHQHQPTIPSTLATELQTNPFLRCQQPAVIAAARLHADREPTSEADVFATIRAWKDRF